MNVLVLQVFVSLMLVAGSIVLFVFSVKQRDYEHADRLSLVPLENDDGPAAFCPETTGKETECRPNESNTTTP